MFYLEIEDFSLCAKDRGMNIDIPSFSLEAGTAMALIGKSGAGKSVFTCLLMGRPSFGVGGKCSLARYSLFGHDFASDLFTSRSKLNVAIGCACREGALMYMPQNFPLSRSSSTTVRSSMSLFLAALLQNGGCPKLDVMKTLMDELSARDLVALVDKPLSKLSGGERRRVELATRLAAIRQCKKPTILLLDEPTTGFDRKSADDFTGEIRRCLQDKELSAHVAVIFATHDLSCLDGDAEWRVADNVAVICRKESKIRLSFCGKPDALREKLKLPEGFSYARDGAQIYDPIEQVLGVTESPSKCAEASHVA